MTNLGAAVVRGLAIAAILVAGGVVASAVGLPASNGARCSGGKRDADADRPRRRGPRGVDRGRHLRRRRAGSMALGLPVADGVALLVGNAVEAYGAAPPLIAAGRTARFAVTAAAGHRVRQAFATVLGGTVLANADPKIIGAAQAVAAGAVLAVVSLAIVPHAFETVSRRSAVATVAASSPARRSAETTFHRRCRNERRRPATAMPMEVERCPR
jgi:hypothetical protein